MLLHLILGEVCKAKARDRCLQNQRDVIEHELTFDPHLLNNEQLSPEQEMVQDLLTISPCFSARPHHCARSNLGSGRSLSPRLRNQAIATQRGRRRTVSSKPALGETVCGV
jgi:hypothetical protein